MDWIVWEMLEKLKADEKILIKAKNELRTMYETSLGDTRQYWRGLLRGYERQIEWTRDNIDKLESMIQEEAKSESDYSEHMRQLRAIGRGGGYIYEDDDPEPTGGLWSTEKGDVY